MMDELIGQFLKSGQAKELLGTLQAHGLSADQAVAALGATAQGVAHHAAGDATANIGSIVTGVLGGGGATAGGVIGALGGMLGGAGGAGGALGGLLGGATTAPAGAPAGGALAGMVGPVAQFVAQKTGLDPALAQSVVTAALPKIMELLAGHPAAAGAAPSGGGGLLGALTGLLR